ncbi:hypothetical protein ACT7C8_00730 [Bacillus cereus]
MQRTPDELRGMLKTRYKIGNIAAKTLVKLSGGKRKFCITELLFETDMTPEEFLEKVTDIIMNNTKEHFYMNVATNPDHYVLVGDEGNTSEVLENPAESPFPFRFWGDYDDTSNLQSEIGEGYTHRLAGAAKLEDGFEIGALHHQLKKEGKGIRLRTLIEFPTALPKHNFHMHQYHLACEFRQWVGYVINDIK